MAAPTQTGSAFPSPYEVPTPPGAEGWQEMYPYHALFHEARREVDENRFWFWNSMHFPLPMPAFDVACADSPYQAIGVWQKMHTGHSLYTVSSNRKRAPRSRVASPAPSAVFAIAR